MAAKKMLDTSTIPPVGTKVWVFEGNGYHRRSLRERWSERVVVAHNKRSVFLAHELNSQAFLHVRTERSDWCDGKTPDRFARDAAAVDAFVWRESNAYRIRDKVNDSLAPEVLAAIADLVGYVEGADREPRPASLRGKKE